PGAVAAPPAPPVANVPGLPPAEVDAPPAPAMLPAPPPPPPPLVKEPVPPPPPPPPPQILPLLTTVTGTWVRSAEPPTPPAVAGVAGRHIPMNFGAAPPSPPLPPAPAIVPLLTILSVLPAGKEPASRAGRLVELEPMRTPLAIVTDQLPGVPAF